MPPIPMRKGHHGRRFSAAPSSAPVERRRIGVAPQHTKRAPKRSRIRADTATLHAPLHPRKRKHKHRSRDPDKSRKKKARLEIEAAETEEEGEEEERKWVFSPRDCSEYKERIVVVSYNILGVENASRHIDLYDRVQPQYLNWEWRKKLICKEIGLYMPGILCFQAGKKCLLQTAVYHVCAPEVDHFDDFVLTAKFPVSQEVDHFDDLADLLHEDGFEGIYKVAALEKPVMDVPYFGGKNSKDLEFQKFGLRDNVAQFCVLKDNNLKVRLFLEKAQRLSQVWGNIPVILAGDLNSMPQVVLAIPLCMYILLIVSSVKVLSPSSKSGYGFIFMLQSAIYQFVASSKLDILMHDRRNMSGKIDHPSSSKPFSNWNAAVSRSPYRHSEELIAVGVVDTLPTNILRKTGGLPSEVASMQNNPTDLHIRRGYCLLPTNSRSEGLNWSRAEVVRKAMINSHGRLGILDVHQRKPSSQIYAEAKFLNQKSEHPYVQARFRSITKAGSWCHPPPILTGDFPRHAAAYGPNTIIKKSGHGLPRPPPHSLAIFVFIRSRMLAIFSGDIVRAPEELVQAGNRTPTPKKSAAKLLQSFLQQFPSGVTLNTGPNMSFCYTHDNQTLLQPRSFAAKDEIFCLFQGALDNLTRLRQQYGLGKNANEVVLVMEAYKALRDRAPYSANHMVAHLAGQFAFIIFDRTTSTVFVAADEEAKVPLFWGITADGYLAFSDHIDVLRDSCGKSLASFPPGCFFTSAMELRSYEHPKNKITAELTTEEEICGATFKVERSYLCATIE
ncbi:hypothetical protein ACLOJK_001350 [Asimina triloba]